MAHDKITVDEPLISTDVDSLIRMIADKKRIPLNELRTICKIDKKTLDKWIAVLEDEGYISIEYGLRGTNVIWKDVEETAAEEKNYRMVGPRSQVPNTPSPEPVPEEPISPIPIEEAANEPELSQEGEVASVEDAAENAPSEEAKDETNEAFTIEAPLEEEPEPEALLSEYLERKRSSGSEDVEDIKSLILTSMKEGPKDEQKDDGPITASDEAEEPESSDDSGSKELSLSEIVKSVEEEPVDSVPEAESEEAEDAEASEDEPEMAEEEPDAAPVKPAYSKETLRPDKERAADVRELMGTYMDEINKEKSKIESLKKERESLYREKFATMEGKMQADIVVLTEKIIEKESKIAEIKERVLELPDKVEELGRLQQQLDTLKKEGREALQRTSARAEEYLGGMRESKSAIEERMAQVESVLDAQSAKVKELERMGGALDARAGKMKAAIDVTKSQLDEMNSAMSSLVDDLQAVEKMKADASSLSDSIKHEVASRGTELASLEEEIAGIERMEHWVQEYIRDYEQKIEDIEHYVSKSEDEMTELKEAAEGLYMKKYLGELENMTDSYQNELHDAVSREKEIEMKLTESRARVTDLVTESQQMIRKLKSEAPEATEKDFGVLVAKVKARTARTKNVVEEKQKERAKLFDESRKTRKTAKPPKGKPLVKKKAPAKSVPSKKRK